MGHLSERLGVRQNALTQAADRLINHGLAERLSDPRDRRVVRLRLTAKGCEWVEARRTRRRKHLHDLWDGLQAQERNAFVQAVRTLEGVAGRLGVQALGSEDQDGEEPGRPLPTVEETLSRFTAGAATGAAARIRADA